MYENAKELIQGDPKFAHMIEKEGGGSSGMWHEYIHYIHDSDYMENNLKEFFIIIPELVKKFEEIKANNQ